MKRYKIKILKLLKDNLWFIFALIGIGLVFLVELPYFIQIPGSVENVSKRIISPNSEVSKGSFNMASVGGIKPNLIFFLLAQILPNWDAVKNSEIVLENETIDEMNLRDTQYLNESISNAKIVALKQANIPYEIVDVVNRIVYLVPGNKNNLKINDEIISIDGFEVTNHEAVVEYINTLAIGSKVNIYVKRNGQKIKLEAEIYLLDGMKKLGFVFNTTYNVKTNFILDFKKEKRESGPSGGLMIALAFYDSLITEDLTKGKKIVGTGTIDINGNVGEISGLKYKLRGAVKRKADIFLVPNANLNEALKLKKDNNYRIEIIGVDNFSQTVELLNKY